MEREEFSQNRTTALREHTAAAVNIKVSELLHQNSETENILHHVVCVGEGG